MLDAAHIKTKLTIRYAPESAGERPENSFIYPHIKLTASDDALLALGKAFNSLQFTEVNEFIKSDIIDLAEI
jgi:hypothetical protein